MLTQNISRRCLFILLTLIFYIQVSTAGETVVLFTGESHCAIFPTVINGEKIEGISQRATTIRKLRKKYKEILLLDGGGAFAGGIYDYSTKGNNLNRVRTKQYISIMDSIGYDAIAIGDEELGFGKKFLISIAKKTSLKFLSANISNSKNILPYKIFNKNGNKIAVVGLTTQESFINNTVNVKNPFASLKSIIGKIRRESDYIIVLSHLGEELTLAIADSFPDINLIYNTHRKRTVRPIFKHKDTWIINFSFGAKELYEFHILKNKKRDKIFKIHKISKKISPYQTITKSSDKTDGKTVLDLYVMSMCPYGVEAENWLLPFVEKFKDKIELNIYFIMSVRDGILSSLHGEEEIKENKRQIIIQKYNYDKYYKYLNCINNNPNNFDNCLAGAEINKKEIDSLSMLYGNKLLVSNFQRTERLKINASPTLYINNVRYEGELDKDHLLRKICDSNKNNFIQECKQIPECLNDEDCVQVGKEGKCFEPGTMDSKCIYRDAEPFNMLLVYDSTRTDNGNLEDVIKTTIKYLPGAKLIRKNIYSKSSESILNKYGINSIPVIILDNKIDNYNNFEKIKQFVYKKRDKYIFKKNIIDSKTYWKRKFIKNRIEFFWSPLDYKANIILKTFLKIAEENKKDITKIKFTPIVMLNKDGKLYANNGKAEMEEISRQLTLKQNELIEYLKVRQKNWQTSYWEEHLEAIGLNPITVKRNSITTNDIKKKIAKNLSKIDNNNNTAFFLINNRHIIQIKNDEQIYKILEKTPNK